MFTNGNDIRVSFLKQTLTLLYLILICPAVEEEASNLNKTVRKEIEEGNSTTLLEQMMTKLEKLRAVDLADSKTTAEEELR